MAAAFAAALACFCLLGWGGVQLIDEYLAQSNYLEREDDRRIQSLQTYVTEHGLSVRSADSLTAWVRKQGLVAIQVYRDGALVYDSNYPSVDFSDQETEELYYAWEQIYYVDFADGEAEVVLHGYYYYQFYNYLTVGALLAAFLLFLTVVMAGIRRTIRYIRALSGEIRILEGAIWSIPSPSGGGTSSPSWPRAWRPCASPSGSRRRASGGSPRPTSGWSPRCPTTCAPP